MPGGPGGPPVSRARPSRRKNCGVRPQFYAARARPCAAGNALSQEFLLNVQILTLSVMLNLYLLLANN